MDLSKLDLNLLVVFHQLLLRKRVSAVAEVLAPSRQPVSRHSKPVPEAASSSRRT